MGDILTDVRILQQRLRDIGLHDWVTKIDDAETGGATGTEILVRLGVCIKELKSQTPRSEADLAKLCNSILRQIDRALKV